MGRKSIPDKFGSRMPQVRILSLGPPFSEKPPKKAVFLRYKFGFRVSLDNILLWSEGKNSGFVLGAAERRNQQNP